MEGNGQSEHASVNRATKVITTVVASLLAFAGFEHGLFETLQGNTPTGGVFIQAIGDAIKWWEYGGEDAFTVIPNYLVTGIAAMAVSIVIVVWSTVFVQRRCGVLVLLLLFILLTAVGGGIGFIPFYLICCAYATRIDKPLNWWRRTLSQKTKRFLGRLWPFTVTGAGIFWILAIEIAIWGYFPGQTDAETLLLICWSFLLVTLILINISYISGFAADIE